jgi:urate oxidase
MAIVLGPNSYGKSEVRLVKVFRDSDPHIVRDLTVDVALEGDFTAAHVEGDNTGLLATDTMRNTVYALAASDQLEHLESFGQRLVSHFVQAGPSVSAARVRIVAHPWARIGTHPHAFERGCGGRRVAVVSGDGSQFAVESGLADLSLMKTTGSGWSGFLREGFTTLPETDDRILATVLSTMWSYGDIDGLDYTAVWEGARSAILEAFGDHFSPSVQFTLRRIGEAVLEAQPEIERIHLSLPNRHHLLFDLERFGLENANEIFHATSEPYGLIEGTVERKPG